MSFLTFLRRLLGHREQPEAPNHISARINPPEQSGGHARQLTLYDVPQPLKYEDVHQDEVTALLVAGIVNPYGPTLTALLALGNSSQDPALSLTRLMLNPFNQEAEVIGELDRDHSWTSTDVHRQLFHLTGDTCPTLFFPSAHLSSADAIALHSAWVRRFPDARKVLDRVTRYYGNPWDRIKEEMEEAFGGLAEQMAGKAQRDEECQDLLAETEATHLAELLLSEEHSRAEFSAFAHAWNGAIEQAPGMDAMTWASFCLTFVHIARECVVPEP